MNKSILFAVSLFISVHATAQTVTYTCISTEHILNRPLVAGKEFQITLEKGFGSNNFYSKVLIQSDFLGSCTGQGKENDNPLAQKYSGTAEIAGTHCAADGFDIYIPESLTFRKVDYIQVNQPPDDILYACIYLSTQN
ncbi:MAG: hypothetical protein BroJett040_11030 [Oligoflexia bacterium]|nr:MAG: hypothetical protein BroJett040_11030 [Oligoflexia bacterium]